MSSRDQERALALLLDASRDNAQPGATNLIDEQIRKRFKIGNRVLFETQTTETEEGQTETVELGQCATCSRVLHDTSEVYALCAICDRELCEEHAVPCDICSKIICSDDAKELFPDTVKLIFNTKIHCCHHHTFFERRRARARHARAR